MRVFDVEQGEIVGLIGTNGAGKSTLLNAIGGYRPVDRLGRVARRRDLAAWASPSGPGAGSAARSRRRRCSPSSPCARRSRSHSKRGVARRSSRRHWRLPRSRRARAHAAGGRRPAHRLPRARHATPTSITDLSTGTRRVVELAYLLALDATVLCLDEPTAGLAQRETEAFGPLLIAIRRELGASMIVIEHDMPLIMSISDHVYCLEAGLVIAQRRPGERASRSERHRQLPRHRRAGDRPQQQCPDRGVARPGGRERMKGASDSAPVGGAITCHLHQAPSTPRHASGCVRRGDLAAGWRRSRRGRTSRC